MSYDLQIAAYSTDGRTLPLTSTSVGCSTSMHYQPVLDELCLAEEVNARGWATVDVDTLRKLDIGRLEYRDGLPERVARDLSSLRDAGLAVPKGVEVFAFLS